MGGVCGTAIEVVVASGNFRASCFSNDRQWFVDGSDAAVLAQTSFISCVPGLAEEAAGGFLEDQAFGGHSVGDPRDNGAQCLSELAGRAQAVQWHGAWF